VCQVGLCCLELLSQAAGACVWLQQVVVGERPAEMGGEEDMTGKSVLKCAGCKLQVCLEEKTCNSLYCLCNYVLFKCKI